MKYGLAYMLNHEKLQVLLRDNIKGKNNEKSDK